MQMVMAEQAGTLARFLPIMKRDEPHNLETSHETGASMHRILLLERSAPLANLLATGLSSESAEVDVAHDIASAMRMTGETAYSLLVLDLDLPDMDGRALIESMRAGCPEARILVLSGRAGVQDLANALDHGADDCLAKPLSLIEFMARVRALRRRSHVSLAPVARPSKLVLHREECRVERDGRTIDLTPREVALLEYMMENPGKTLSRSLLSQHVWNMPAEANTNIVDVYIKYLRDKLDEGHDEKLIRTVRGMGYLFQMAA